MAVNSCHLSLDNFHSPFGLTASLPGRLPTAQADLIDKKGRIVQVDLRVYLVYVLAIASYQMTMKNHEKCLMINGKLAPALLVRPGLNQSCQTDNCGHQFGGFDWLRNV